MSVIFPYYIFFILVEPILASTWCFEWYLWDMQIFIVILIALINKKNMESIIVNMVTIRTFLVQFLVILLGNW